MTLFGKDSLINQVPEKDFQESVCHAARLYGWKIYSVPDSRRASLAGYPDLTMWHTSKERLIFAELKREKGKVSLAQDTVLEELRQLPQVEVYVWRPSMWDEIVMILR